MNGGRARSFVVGSLKVAVFSVLFAVGAGIVAYHTVGAFIRGTSVSTPSITSKSTEEALVLLKEADLFLLLDRVERSESVAAGGITWQNPPAGREIKRWSQVLVRVSEGSGSVRVAPEWTGMSRERAIAEILEAGSRVGTVSVIPAEGIAADTVAATDPPGGFSVGRRGVVNLLVASSSPEGEKFVPNFYNQTVADAERELKVHGISARVTDRISDSEAAPGTIDGQYPPSGARMNGVREVELVVVVHPSDLVE